MRRKRPKPPLPSACEFCRPYEGRWANAGSTANPRLERCTCALGRALAGGLGRKRKPVARPLPDWGHAAAGDR